MFTDSVTLRRNVISAYSSHAKNLEFAALTTTTITAYESNNILANCQPNLMYVSASIMEIIERGPRLVANIAVELDSPHNHHQSLTRHEHGLVTIQRRRVR